MSNNCETVKVSFYATTKDLEKLEGIVSHHLDYLIDLESNFDVLTDVYRAKVEKCLNTEISYLYRDTGNYKRFTSIVIAGAMTEDQEKIIQSCLYDGEWFLPEPVGLPANDLSAEYGYDDELDHPWFEWQYAKFVNEAPTPGFEHVTVNDLVRRFQAARDKWEFLSHDYE